MNDQEKNELILEQSKQICALKEDLKQFKSHLEEMEVLVVMMSIHTDFEKIDKDTYYTYLQTREAVENLLNTPKYNHISSGVFRNLVRITKVEEDTVNFCLPGWDHSVEVTIAKSKLPQDLLPLLEVDYRFYANAPMNVDHPEQIFLENLEYAPNEDMNVVEARVMSRFEINK